MANTGTSVRVPSFRHTNRHLRWWGIRAPGLFDLAPSRMSCNSYRAVVVAAAWVWQGTRGPRERDWCALLQEPRVGGDGLLARKGAAGTGLPEMFARCRRTRAMEHWRWSAHSGAAWLLVSFSDYDSDKA